MLKEGRPGLTEEQKVDVWLAGTHRGHAGLADVLRKASEEVEMTHPEPPNS